jgi:hypothetical protein
MSDERKPKESVELLKIMLFSFVVIGFYVWFSNSIPQLRAEAPKEEQIELGALTMDSFIALGEQIYHGKGNCELCHNPVGKRAPLLIDSTDEPPIGARAEERIKGAGYSGNATTGQEYMHESMIEPSVYVVPGYGKKGTNDTVSPMPDVRGGSIGLNELEINALIAFFQAQAGVEVTVELPSEVPPPTGSETKKEGGEIQMAASAEEAFVKFECKLCHLIPGMSPDEGEGELGPDLNGIHEFGAKRVKGKGAKEYIRESIVDPNAFISPDFDADVMPPDFPERMTVKELEMIVQYLSEPQETPAEPEPVEAEEGGTQETTEG